LDTISTVYISRHLCREMLEYARAQLPLEACGIVSGDLKGRPLQFFPARNELKSPTRYNVHPEDLLCILNQLEQNQEDIWAIFHSHPESDAYPTKTDLELAGYPQAYYLIASLKNPQHPVLRGFIIRDGSIKEINLEEN